MAISSGYAIQARFLEGIRSCSLSLMNDKCCQPKGKAFARECVTYGIAQVFTSYNSPKGTSEIGRKCSRLRKNFSGCMNDEVGSIWTTTPKLSFGDDLPKADSCCLHSSRERRTHAS